MAELNIPAGVGEGQGDPALAAAQDDLDAILKGGPSADPLPPPSAPPEPPAESTMATVGRNVSEIPRAVGSGVVRGFDAVIGLGDMLQEAMPVPGFQIFDMEGNFAPAFSSPEEIARDTAAKNEAGYSAIPNPLTRPETVTGQLTEGVSQFLSGFITGGAALKAVGAAKSLPFFARASGQGMFADFAAFDGHEERLSNWLAQEGNPELVRTVGEFLAADPNDTEIEGRLKNVMEGAALDVAFAGVLTGLKAIKQARQAKADIGGATFQDAARKMEKETLASGRAPASGKADPLSSLGSSSPDAPLVIKPDKTPPPVGQARRAPPPGAVNGAKRVNLEGGEVFINFARISTDDDVKNVIKEMAERSSSEIDAARRGVIPNKVTEKAADTKYDDAFQAILSRRRGEGVPPQDVQLAMRRLWASSAEKLMEAAKAVEANSTAENMLAFRRMVLTHKLIQEQVIAVRTETARALQQWSIPAGAVAKDKIDAINRALDQGGGIEVTVDLARQFSSLADEVAVNPRNMSKLAGAVDKASKATTLQAAAEIWKGVSLLSGVKTHARNLISNTGMIFTSIAERAVAARAAGLIDEKTAVEVGEATRYATGVVHNLRQAWLDAADTFRTGQMKMGASQLDNHFGAMRSRQLDPKTASGRVFWALSHAASPVYRFLQASDQMMKTLNYSGEVYALAWRTALKEVDAKRLTPDGLKDRVAELIANPTREMDEAATAAAERGTFTEKPGEWTKMALRAREKIPALEFVLPFISTPANIFRTSLLSTPMAPLLKRYREAIAKGGSEAIIARTRLGIGTSVMLTTMDLAMNDRITGSGPDPASSEFKALQRAGWKPYSIKIGDKWVSYQGFEPFTTVLGLGADLGEAMKRAGDMSDDPGDAVEQVMDAVSSAVFGVANNMLERSFMTGLADILSAVIEPKQNAENWWSNFAASFTPRILLDIRQSMDPAIYDARTFVDKVLQRIPGATGGLTQRRDEWGRPLTIDSGLGRFYDIVSPFAVSKAKLEPIDKELLEQGMSLGVRNRVMTVDRLQIPLKNRPDIHNRFLEFRGATKPSEMGKVGARLRARYGDMTLLETLNAVVSGNHKISKYYQKGSDGQDGEKHKILRRILTDYSKAATTLTLKEFPELLDNAKAKRQVRIDRAARGEELFETTLGP